MYIFMSLARAVLFPMGILGLTVFPARAQETLDSGDTAWMLTATALVLMMTIPGLALFYGGMVRKKNVLATSDAGLFRLLPGDRAVDGRRLFDCF